jgi:dihydropteroate synthase
MSGSYPGRRPGVPRLLAPAASAAQAARALAQGADLIDATGAGAQELAEIRARCPGDVVWPGAPGTPADVDLIAARAVGLDGAAPAAAVIAAAAIQTWLGAGLIRTSHVREVRRAIDMAASIAGARPPALTIRGLA